MVKTIEEMEGLIYLEDGTVFKGIGFGARGTACGRAGFQHIHDRLSEDLDETRPIRARSLR